jgi:hypothetical protein
MLKRIEFTTKLAMSNHSSKSQPGEAIDLVRIVGSVDVSAAHQGHANAQGRCGLYLREGERIPIKTTHAEGLYR